MHATTLRMTTLLGALFATAAHAQLEPEATCIEGVEPLLISYGEHTAGCMIETVADIDSFEFSGTAGDVVQVIVAGLPNGFDPEVTILLPNGSELTTESCVVPSYQQCALPIDVELPQTGDYTLILSEVGSDQAGGYQLQLERTPPTITPPETLHQLSAPKCHQPCQRR